jgi:hypothetical protein
LIDTAPWTNAVIWGVVTVIVGFIVMLCVMKIAKKYETSGSLIVLRTATYVVFAGLAMIILAVSFMLISAFLASR